jgi:hypothetical protein
MSQEKEEIEQSTISRLKLSEQDVLEIVLEWYTQGMCPDIFQNKDGLDLEEYIEEELYN